MGVPLMMRRLRAGRLCRHWLSCVLAFLMAWPCAGSPCQRAYHIVHVYLVLLVHLGHRLSWLLPWVWASRMLVD